MKRMNIARARLVIGVLLTAVVLLGYALAPAAWAAVTHFSAVDTVDGYSVDGTTVISASGLVDSQGGLKVNGTSIAGSGAGLTLADGKVYVGNASGIATAVTPSGDATITNTGVVAIGTGVVVNADLSATAAVDFSKLAALTSGYVIVGSATNVPTSVAMSGDVTIVASGATTIGTGAVTSGKLSELTIQYATVTLTNAQVLNLRATPISMVAAPGAGKRIQFLGATLNVDGTAGGYTEGAVNLAFKMVNGSGVAVSQTVETTGFIDVVGKAHTNALPLLDTILTEAQGVNVALVLHNTGGAEFGGGNAADTLKVTIAYRVVGTI